MLRITETTFNNPMRAYIFFIPLRSQLNTFFQSKYLRSPQNTRTHICRLIWLKPAVCMCYVPCVGCEFVFRFPRKIGWKYKCLFSTFHRCTFVENSSIPKTNCDLWLTTWQRIYSIEFAMTWNIFGVFHTFPADSIHRMSRVSI